jgi:hypothetical protein
MYQNAPNPPREANELVWKISPKLVSDGSERRCEQFTRIEHFVIAIKHAVFNSFSFLFIYNAREETEIDVRFRE